MDLVEVARFEEGSSALVVARFLRKHGVWAKAFVPDNPGGSGRYGQSVTRGRVVVENQDQERAYALFNRVRRGEFVDDPRHKAINQLVLGGPSEEPEDPPIRATPVVTAGRILIGMMVAPLVIAALLQWFGVI